MAKQQAYNQRPGSDTLKKRTPRSESSGVLVLHKTLDILEAIKNTPGGLSLADLSRAVRMPKPTAYRITSTLESRGYLDRTTEGGYQVSRKLFELQRRTTDEQVIIRAAQPIMDRLVESCQETVNLGILDAGEVVVINTIESPQGIRMASKIGNRRYLHSTALGKVLLCGLPERELQRLIRVKGLPKLTPFTLTTVAGLKDELELIRERGYSIDNEENELNGRCLGAPIFGPYGRMVSALSISGPSFRMTVEHAHSLAPQLLEACRSITQSITS
ncbi:MAG: IclR family transcriptional regulator [Acidobacteria bacterium]|nr:MAG: IclR family transcriptional regulator [Acidobacteriota bacterium]